MTLKMFSFDGCIDFWELFFRNVICVFISSNQQQMLGNFFIHQNPSKQTFLYKKLNINERKASDMECWKGLWHIFQRNVNKGNGTMSWKKRIESRCFDKEYADLIW